MKPFIFRFILFSAVAFLVFSVVGTYSAPRYNVSIPDGETTSELKRTVGSEMTPQAEFSFSRGETYHGWVIKRSLLHGLPVTAQPMSVFEQSLHVGWPLTVVQGFIHQNGPEKHTHGAFLFSSKIEPPYDKMIPYEPVWLGILFWGLVGAATAFIRKKK